MPNERPEMRSNLFSGHPELTLAHHKRHQYGWTLHTPIGTREEQLRVRAKSLRISTAQRQWKGRLVIPHTRQADGNDVPSTVGPRRHARRLRTALRDIAQHFEPSSIRLTPTRMTKHYGLYDLEARTGQRNVSYRWR